MDATATSYRGTTHWKHDPSRLETSAPVDANALASFDGSVRQTDQTENEETQQEPPQPPDSTTTTILLLLLLCVQDTLGFASLGSIDSRD